MHFLGSLLKSLTWTLHSLSVCLTQTADAWNGHVCARSWPDGGCQCVTRPGWLGPFQQKTSGWQLPAMGGLHSSALGQGNRWMDSCREDGRGTTRGRGASLSDLALPLLVGLEPAWLQSQVWKLKMLWTWKTIIWIAFMHITSICPAHLPSKCKLHCLFKSI